jgi:2,4-dienoyl-CoA reductase-like NADH-dependent reductase (Old Yellow Enzyme family)
VPWEKKGNVLSDTVQVAKWCEQDGADAIHVSTGSLFPHPLNPPGDFSFETIATTYDAMISSGVDTFRNFLLFRYKLLRPIFRWVWFRMKKGLPFEAVSMEEARAIKAAVSIPVLNTGGYQTASVIRDGINSGAFDGVAIARSLLANNDLVRWWESGHDRPPRPCTYCNKCLLNAPKNPMGCYELSRYDSREQMIDNLMSIYAVHPTLNLPPPGVVELPPKPSEMLPPPGSVVYATSIPKKPPERPSGIMSS